MFHLVFCNTGGGIKPMLTKLFQREILEFFYITSRKSIKFDCLHKINKYTTVGTDTQNWTHIISNFSTFHPYYLAPYDPSQ